MKDFKTFKTIQKYLKLYENQAGDDPNLQDPNAVQDDGSGDAEAMPEQPADGEAMPDATQPDTENPEQEANPEDGIFISDIKKAEFAKLLISALMNEVPNAGSVPDEMLNVTTNNADDVIKYVQTLLNLDTTLSTDNEENEKSFASAVKGV